VARLCGGGGDARADHVLVIVCTGTRGTCESERLVERVRSAAVTCGCVMLCRLGLFVSFRTLELVTDSVDPERVGLSRHRQTRLLAPWTMEVGGDARATAVC
jgi:hypothetical protein